MYIIIGAFIITVIFEILTKRKSVSGQISNDPLTIGEKALTWVVCFFNPILAGAILYYGWRNKLPVKAKEANRISWIVFVVFIVVVIVAKKFGWV